MITPVITGKTNDYKCIIIITSREAEIIIVIMITAKPAQLCLQNSGIH